jgi:hypothetical protein
VKFWKEINVFNVFKVTYRGRGEYIIINIFQTIFSKILIIIYRFMTIYMTLETLISLLSYNII